jgi:hypothetical protein
MERQEIRSELKQRREITGDVGRHEGKGEGGRKVGRTGWRNEGGKSLTEEERGGDSQGGTERIVWMGGEGGRGSAGSGGRECVREGVWVKKGKGKELVWKSGRALMKGEKLLGEGEWQAIGQGNHRREERSECLSEYSWDAFAGAGRRAGAKGGRC